MNQSSDVTSGKREKKSPGMLARFGGEPVPGPTWFQRALACEPERSFVEVEGANIELLAWGQRGYPGLLFLHGHAAHADVWRFIAPFFTENYRVGALSWSGMGGSDWRPEYHMDLWVAELMCGAQALGLFDAPCAPVVIAHSAGAKPALIASAKHGQSLNGVVVADSAIPGPAPLPSRNRSEHRIYPTLSEALGRFRFGPEQSCDNLFIVDRIARDSLKKVEDGWTWKFDTQVSPWIAREEAWEALTHAQCRLAWIVGEQSVVPKIARRQLPPDTPYFVLPEAQHHLMADQPLAFVAAIRGLLASWEIAL